MKSRIKDLKAAHNTCRINVSADTMVAATAVEVEANLTRRATPSPILCPPAPLHFSSSSSFSSSFFSSTLLIHQPSSSVGELNGGRLLKNIYLLQGNAGINTFHLNFSLCSSRWGIKQCQALSQPHPPTQDGGRLEGRKEEQHLQNDAVLFICLHLRLRPPTLSLSSSLLMSTSVVVQC